MKIAIVLSGLVRFPEQGFYLLKEIINHSNHDIDIFAGVWSIDSVPESISPYLFKTAVIPYTLRDEIYDMLENKHLLGRHLSELFIEGHSGLISHMATCSVFSEDLKHYDAVIKWRWDVAVTCDYFELLCKNYQGLTNTLLSDQVYIEYGKPCMNEVIFISDPELMIKSFTPVKERFLRLGEILDYNLKQRENYVLSTFISHASLVSDVFGTIRITPLRWALLRRNILDNTKLLYSNNTDTLLKLQREADLERDRLILEKNKNNK